MNANEQLTAKADAERIAKLEAEVAELRAATAHDNDSRAQLLAAADAAVPALARQQALWERIFAASVDTVRRSQEIGDARHDGLLPKIAIIMTRQTALETQFHILAGVAIEDHEAIRELVDLVRRARE